MDTVAAFASLFQGRTDVWGSVEGRSNKEPVTEKLGRRGDGDRQMMVFLEALLDFKQRVKGIGNCR